MKSLEEVKQSTLDFLNAEDVAELIGAHPQTIRSQAQAAPEKLGFPVIVSGNRVRIPRVGFIYFCEFGKNANA